MKKLGKKMESMKKLAKKVKVLSSSGSISHSTDYYEYLVSSDDISENSPTSSSSSPSSSSFSSSFNSSSSSATTPTGSFAIYVGEERQRFVVPTSFLSHPLFKMLLEKSYDEYGFEQRNGLVIPCTVSAFQEVLIAVECCHGQFDLGRLVQEFS